MPIFERSGTKLDLPVEILPPDLINKLTQKNAYDLQEARALKQFVERNDVVMDVGAGVVIVFIIAA